MPYILDTDEDKYFDSEELRQLKKGTGLFPSGHKGHGLFPPGHKPQSGYGYEMTGDGIIDSLISLGSTVGSTLAANKDLIANVAQAGTSVASAVGKIADTIKTHKKNKKIQAAAIPQKINLDTLKKIRQDAGISSGSGFRFT